MPDDDTTRLALSRRQLLGALGSIGAASVGAGVGTTALFSDEESFENNSITAGTLNLQVSGDIHTHSRAGTLPMELTQIEGSAGATANGTLVRFVIGDLKPGDWVIVETEFEIFGNPAYAQILSPDVDLTSEEGGTPEPEQTAGGAGGPDGELEHKMLTTWWQRYTAPANGRAPLEGLKGATNVADGTKPNQGYANPQEDGNVAGSSDVHYTTLQEAYTNLRQSGMVLTSGGAPLELQPGTVTQRYLLLEVPPEVGNEIQGDSVTFDIVFKAEQVRNNPTPFDS